MPITLGQFGNFNTSRVKKMVSASNQAEATYMGGWDKFKDLFRGTSKREQLNNLWNELQSNSADIQTPAIKKFTTFTKIKDLANEDHKDQFTANLEKSPIGLTSKLTLRIGNQNILTTDHVSFLEDEVINHFVESSGQIKPNTNEASIAQQQQQQQQQATTKIQAHYKGYKSKSEFKNYKELTLKISNSTINNQTELMGDPLYQHISDVQKKALIKALNNRIIPKLILYSQQNNYRSSQSNSHEEDQYSECSESNLSMEFSQSEIGTPLGNSFVETNLPTNQFLATVEHILKHAQNAISHVKLDKNKDLVIDEQLEIAFFGLANRTQTYLAKLSTINTEQAHTLTNKLKDFQSNFANNLLNF